MHHSEYTQLDHLDATESTTARIAAQVAAHIGAAQIAHVGAAHVTAAHVAAAHVAAHVGSRLSCRYSGEDEQKGEDFEHHS